MPHVVVLATGGTIASTRDASGASTASRGIGSLLEGADWGGITVESRDVLRTNSFLLTHADLRLLCEEVAREAARGDVDGVVLTHGTDTMEETAFLLDLVHGGSKPVVLTGAQRPADALDSDGPVNLRQAIAVAGSGAAASRGVLIAFAGHVYPARGTRKAHTVAAAPFRTADGGPVGSFVGDRLRFAATPDRPAPLPPPTDAFDTTRVDVVSVHPGADAVLARAAVAAGARGVVIAGSGVGNGNHALRDWVAEATGAGIAVGLSTRVPEGPVLPFYGNGGGEDLVRAGALPLGALPLYQARLLLAVLLASGARPTPELIGPYT